MTDHANWLREQQKITEANKLKNEASQKILCAHSILADGCRDFAKKLTLAADLLSEACRDVDRSHLFEEETREP